MKSAKRTLAYIVFYKRCAISVACKALREALIVQCTNTSPFLQIIVANPEFITEIKLIQSDLRIASVISYYISTRTISSATNATLNRTTNKNAGGTVNRFGIVDLPLS